jgi:hypothetical protein
VPTPDIVPLLGCVSNRNALTSVEPWEYLSPNGVLVNMQSLATRLRGFHTDPCIGNEGAVQSSCANYPKSW